jgi:hypothetical protein
MVQGNGSVEDIWPKVLPMVQLGAKTYFVDLRLRQFREVNNPHLYVDFGSDAGRQMCGMANIVSCPDCGISIIVPGVWRGQDLSCIRCLTVLP